jgi:hypothetical protein
MLLKKGLFCFENTSEATHNLELKAQRDRYTVKVTGFLMYL